MSIRRQIGFWFGAFVVACLALWILGGALLPFVAGMAIAYLLDPVADRLERIGLSRTVAVAVIMIGLLVLVLVAGVILVPLLAGQVETLVSNLPGYGARLQRLVSTAMEGRIGKALGGDRAAIEARLGALLTQGSGWILQLLGSIWNGGQAVVSILSLFVISPVVAAYLLVDWDRMIAEVDGWLPVRHRETIRMLANDMNGAVAGFVRGQFSVCLAMAVFYSAGLAMVGLNFALVIGMLAGLLGFVPFVGFGVGLVGSLGVALVQFWPDWHWILAVLAVFFAGQILEGYVLQPNWIGRSVGLHPVWLLFALFAFGSLFGFLGLLIAVPAAAAIGVLARFALARYLESPLYTGVPAAVALDRDEPPLYRPIPIAIEREP